eukprot:7606090-Alexandrium_andersonii.AAC.1
MRLRVLEAPQHEHARCLCVQTGAGPVAFCPRQTAASRWAWSCRPVPLPRLRCPLRRPAWAALVRLRGQRR